MREQANYKQEPIIKLSKIINLLGNILGLVIKEQEGVSLFNKVEKIRVLSKASRGIRNNKEISHSFFNLLSLMGSSPL